MVKPHKRATAGANAGLTLVAATTKTPQQHASQWLPHALRVPGAAPSSR